MELKKTYTRKLTEKQLKVHTRDCAFHSKIPQEDGSYLVNYTRYKLGTYEELVNKLVKEKYSDSEEFAILRKSISNPNNTEYVAYNTYVEQCKVEAKAFIEERKQILGR